MKLEAILLARYNADKKNNHERTRSTDMQFTVSHLLQQQNTTNGLVCTLHGCSIQRRAAPAYTYATVRALSRWRLKYTGMQTRRA